jgi:hypothetical protein
VSPVSPLSPVPPSELKLTIDLQLVRPRRVYGEVPSLTVCCQRIGHASSRRQSGPVQRRVGQMTLRWAWPCPGHPRTPDTIRASKPIMATESGPKE